MAKQQIDYTIVIPAFNCASQLRFLIRDIHANCQRYRPKLVLIVDDGSTDEEMQFVAGLYNSEMLPIKCISSTMHLGPLNAEKLGLDNVETELAVVLHSDTVLSDRVSRIKHRVYQDTLSVLVCYLAQTEDAIAISVFSLCVDNPVIIQNGPRSLGIDGLPYSFYREYRFASLRKIKNDDWREVYSVDGSIYAMRMKYYRETGGFDEQFAPYLFYHDDFFARAREHGFRTYFTQDAVAYHPRFTAKPEGSLAITNNDLYQRNANIFLERWRGSSTWYEECFKRKIISKRDIEERV